MKLTFALFLMTTTLGTGSEVLAAGQGRSFAPDASQVSRTALGADLTLIDGDGDENEGGRSWSLSDDEEDDDDCEDDDEGEGCVTGAAGNAAKAGTVAPPKNGLFTDGTAPVVKSN